MQKRTCSEWDCGSSHYARGLCRRCYDKARKGTLGKPRIADLTPVERFWYGVVQSDGCWEWTGAHDVYGYSLISVEKKQGKAHRFAYELLVGPIPDGLVIDHLCRNRGCVNPAHLEPVESRVNTLRGETIPAGNLRKTHCPQGHPYGGENLKVYKGFRLCRTCRTERDSRRRGCA